MDRSELLKKLEHSDIGKIKFYLDVLEKTFLQTVIVKALNREEIDEIISGWLRQIKTEINFQSNVRNEFVMGTDAGRMLSARDEVEDGEAVRLSCVDAMKLAHEIASLTYQRDV